MRIVKTGDGYIPIGKQGENNAVTVQFNVVDWITDEGTGGTFQLLHQRSTDTQPHAVVVTYSNGAVSWVVANTEVAIAGYGECELQYYQGETLLKSKTWATRTEVSMSDAGSTPPEPWQSWVEEVLEAGITATTAASTAQTAATSASQSASAAETAKESIEESAEQIETNKEDIETLKTTKTQDVHLYSDGNAIWMYGDTTETPLTYTQIKTLTENETNNVYLTNGYYSFHNKYRYDKTISGQGEDAIGFIGSTQLNGKVYSYRIVINENNEVSADEIEVANESDLTTHTSNTTIHVTAADKTTWNAKQNAISDLETIRSGAAKGTTALQSVPSTYRTSAAQDTIDAKKADLVDGKVPSSQLPSYVDDVVEYASKSQFPTTGESGKIYVALDTNLTYRWGGTEYVEISSSLALGETADTAFRGDYGKVAYDLRHSHSNKALLDSYTQTEANLASAVSLKHSHSNKTVLDGITADKVSSWDAKQNAITDLENIRSGASKGATALQSVPSTYRTSAAQDTIDATKADKTTVDNLIEAFSNLGLTVAEGEIRITYLKED